MNLTNWSWPDLLAYPGVALTLYGFYQIAPVLSFIVGGGLLIVLALLTGIEDVNKSDQ